MPIYYKYRSLNDWKYILDIFINQRLYSAQYRDLNDPMEGIYFYDTDVSREFSESIKHEKLKLRICSLSKKHDDTLMWSHYSDSHRGIVLGVGMNDSEYNIEEIDYVDKVIIENLEQSHSPNDIARKILRKKLNAWYYEDEVRILLEDEYVNIEIKEIYLGCKMDEFDESLIRSLSDNYLSRVRIKKLHTNDFNGFV